MVEIACRRLQTVGYIADGVAVGELIEYHAYQLAPCVITLAMLIRISLTDNRFNDFFGQLSDYLCEKCYICHMNERLM